MAILMTGRLCGKLVRESEKFGVGNHLSQMQCLLPFGSGSLRKWVVRA